MHTRVNKKVLVCAPSNSAVDGVALTISAMLPPDHVGDVLREHVLAAEQEFALLSDKEADEFVPKTKEDSELLAMTQLDQLCADDIETSESTKAAIDEMHGLHPKHFYARTLSTAQWIRRTAVAKVNYFKGRDLQGLPAKEKERLEACQVILRIGSEFTAMPSGEAKVTAASNFNRAMGIMRIEAYERCSMVITTCGNSANKVLAKHFNPDACFVDEAAQATESDVYIANTAFSTVKQDYLCGDDAQLACIVPSLLTNEFEFSADSSTFKRLRQCGIPVYQLRTQYRMTQNCNRLTNQAFYGGNVVTAIIMNEPNKITPMVTRFMKKMFGVKEDHGEVMFVDLPNSVSYKDEFTPSCVNPVEAILAAKLVSGLLGSEPELDPASIGVICMYKAQITYIKGKVASEMAEMAKEQGWTEELLPDISRIVYYTVDSSQGREVDIAIVSFGACGVRDFQNDDEGVDTEAWNLRPHVSRHVHDVRHVNVATSRQKYGMFILGNLDGLIRGVSNRKTESPFHHFLELVKSLGLVHTPTADERATLEEKENQYILGLHTRRQQLIDSLHLTKGRHGTIHSANARGGQLNRGRGRGRGGRGGRGGNSTGGT